MPARIRWRFASPCWASRGCSSIRQAGPMRCAISTQGACATSFCVWRRFPTGRIATRFRSAPVEASRSTSATSVISPRWCKRRSRLRATSSSIVSGSSATSAARSSIPARRESSAGRGSRRPRRRARPGDHDRSRPCRAGQLRQRQATAHGSGPASRSAFRHDRPSADRSRRTGSAARHSGALQRHFRRHRQAHP